MTAYPALVSCDLSRRNIHTVSAEVLDFYLTRCVINGICSRLVLDLLFLFERFLLVNFTTHEC